MLKRIHFSSHFTYVDHIKVTDRLTLSRSHFCLFMSLLWRLGSIAFVWSTRLFTFLVHAVNLEMTTLFWSPEFSAIKSDGHSDVFLEISSPIYRCPWNNATLWTLSIYDGLAIAVFTWILSRRLCWLIVAGRLIYAPPFWKISDAMRRHSQMIWFLCRHLTFQFVELNCQTTCLFETHSTRSYWHRLHTQFLRQE